MSRWRSKVSNRVVACR